jgi:hypothetical protein
MVIWTRIHTRYGTRAQELDGRQLVHDVLALFVNLRESEVVFNLELRQDLRIEQSARNKECKDVVQGVQGQL